MTTLANEKQRTTVSKKVLYQSKKEKTQLIIQHWIRILNIKLGWIHDFDKLVANYIATVFILDTFISSSKLIKTFCGHIDNVWSIDYSTFDCNHLLCSGSSDATIRVWDIDANKQIQLLNNENSSSVYCVKFSSYHYHNYHRNIICFCSYDNTIRFWDIKDNQQLQIFNEHTRWVGGIEFSSFNGGRYLCSGSADTTMRLWDVETSKSLHVFDGHTSAVRCVDFSPLQNSNNDNKNNNIGVIGGNGYTICSGSWEAIINIWDIETTKQLNTFEGHKRGVNSVKYGSNELINTILSGSEEGSVRLWDIRSGKQIQVFYGHTDWVNTVEYSPFIVNNIEVDFNSNVICSGSSDNTIRFWDVRSNKKELYVINGDKEIICFKFLQIKKNKNNCYDINLCYGSRNGLIHIWG
ncbi:WD-repeat protein [Reticulomyxa filosa]|uniref:WD-repeat protein n=1 Tax=Reticulomyxa filosa TaxID=46433 RepID=X6LXN0_RETFI|nr:WD-repeat protein [Reticulomyxa filosa]|eukprot:ETO06131.1 WD-repeat protein [Reticulomyxa filosa]